MGRALYAISRWLAVAGGLLLFAMALLTAASVSGRALFGLPVPGDFELVGIGTGVAVFAILPWCQITRGNVLVDFFMSGASPRAKAVCDAIGGLLYLGIASLLTWRLALGGLDMYQQGERSMTTGFPRWTTFPIAFVLMAFLVLVIAYTLWQSIREARAGR